ncbi:indole-3-pyruvate monooxygenase-like protein [Emericellopsis cladophorae]|uniref:Indole-3-pyruvate monooxygenase-like protein n=1 Tax=Emericellopsis cladophorae TaxID=2686198 RepID=A0A9P9Y091_9HYPO|nr:indole-3-pyruvate monooxygenase-like protein [Emericellopsis cladophorae]KAI6780916.1 indole-3-pyruvate monooxygenase-like protein [Emericellopsis cladophorae]
MGSVSAADEVPSHVRCVPGSVNIHVATQPSTPPKGPIDPDKVASTIVELINSALGKQDLSGLAGLFVDNGYWRDHLALSWAFRTPCSPQAIQKFLQDSAKSRDGFRLKSVSINSTSKDRAPQITKLDNEGKVDGVRFFIALETAIGRGSGLIRATQDNGQWKIYTVYTRLDEIKGHEEALHQRRPRGVDHGGHPGRKNWAERRQEESNFLDKDPTVLIVGAGQAGLTASARLKMLGIPALMIDSNARIGDNWRKRYHQLVLHDPVWYDHLPYMPFPAQWPVFTPKDKLADFFEAYAKLLELDAWTSTELVKTEWDAATKTWSVTVKRAKADGTSETRTLHPKHLIQATGHSGKKNVPDLPGAADFQGHRLCHSSEFPGARQDGQGKKAVVVGSCNSAHDIAQDFLEKGYDVTIVQRSSTHVVSSKGITDISNKDLYCEGGPPVDDADMLVHGLPTSVLKAAERATRRKHEELDSEMLAGLAKAGFKVDKGPDDAGLMFKYLQRGGGYYIDVGASALIASGDIKVKQGQEIARVLPNGLQFADGSTLEADEIVLATGYQNMRTQTRLMFGDHVADKVDEVWGLNEEGEFRTIWQHSGHPGFWFHGGNLALCRYYSKLLALQIMGLEAGLYKEGEI